MVAVRPPHHTGIGRGVAHPAAVRTRRPLHRVAGRRHEICKQRRLKADGEAARVPRAPPPKSAAASASAGRRVLSMSQSSGTQSREVGSRCCRTVDCACQPLAVAQRGRQANRDTVEGEDDGGGGGSRPSATEELATADDSRGGDIPAGPRTLMVDVGEAGCWEELYEREGVVHDGLHSGDCPTVPSWAMRVRPVASFCVGLVPVGVAKLFMGRDGSFFHREHLSRATSRAGEVDNRSHLPGRGHRGGMFS